MISPFAGAPGCAKSWRTTYKLTDVVDIHHPKARGCLAVELEGIG